MYIEDRQTSSFWYSLALKWQDTWYLWRWDLSCFGWSEYDFEINHELGNRKDRLSVSRKETSVPVSLHMLRCLSETRYKKVSVSHYSPNQHMDLYQGLRWYAVTFWEVIASDGFAFASLNVVMLYLTIRPVSSQCARSVFCVDHLFLS
jgi:hypothetical protein